MLRRVITPSSYTRIPDPPALRLSDSAPVVISGLPNGAPDAFEVAGSYVFATYGTTVYAVTPD